MTPSVLVAPDSFKGTHRAAEVAAALGRGLVASGVVAPDLCPVADGGEGTVETLLGALGGTMRTVEVHDPIGRRVEASFGVLDDGRTAVIEMAAASGLQHLAPDELDAEAASTYGTGELLVAAWQAGATRLVVGAGGSATTDGGAGALAAVQAGGGLHDAVVTVLCDVTTAWERAPVRYGPQKGAGEAAVGRLERRLASLALELPRDPTGVPMTGAAGGLAGGLWAACGARLTSGAEWVLDAVGLDGRLRDARCVVTGEGRLDDGTLEGKLVGTVGARARDAGVPLYAVVGRDALSDEGRRLLDVDRVLEASTLDELEAAGAAIGARVRSCPESQVRVQ